jgi:trimeric autotransporter adhesin
MKTKRMITLYVRNSINRSPSWRFGWILIPLVLAYLTLPRTINAADGGLAGGNTAEGDNALNSLTSGTGNTAIGNRALFSDASGNDNTASGLYALYYNTTGIENTANGVQALFNNTNGGFNTATGYRALLTNTTGSHNTATGFGALFSNMGVTPGNRDAGGLNTATGSGALFSNTTGSDNTATGFRALFSNTTGSNNTAYGVRALYYTNASNNTAYGVNALFRNTTGYENTATGFQALKNNLAGFSNTAIGYQALFNDTEFGNTAAGDSALFANTGGRFNTAVGLAALVSNTTGAGNIALGRDAGLNLTTGDNNIDIGNDGFPAEANTIRIGTVDRQTTTFIAGIRGVTVPNGVTVIVGTDGHLGTVQSSARFKEAIKPMDKSSEAILALKPVTFRYKKELDPDSIPQFGLVAEEVEKVNPALVARDVQGKPYTVRYEAVNAMLLNEFLKEHRKVEKLTKDFQATVAQQQKEIQALTGAVKDQAAQIQKVSAKLEVSKPAPRVIANKL